MKIKEDRRARRLYHRLRPKSLALRKLRSPCRMVLPIAQGELRRLWCAVMPA